MWEVLAPIVRWPLYSPARFFGVVAAVLVAVFAVGEVNGEAPTTSAAAAAASPSVEAVPARVVPTSPSAAASPSAPGSGPAATDELSGDPAGVDSTTAAVDTAAAFVAAWARPDLDAEAWAAGVRPLATDDLWTDGLSATDPAGTPDVTVRGEPRQVAINAEEAVFDVPTTGAWVRVHLAAADGGWLVSRVEPAS